MKTGRKNTDLVNKYPPDLVRILTAIVLLGLLACEACFAKSPTYDNITAFGDSLTDVGNVAGVTNPNVAPRIDGYYQETHFCDNILWVEILAAYWGLPPRTPGRGDSTTLPPETGGNIWAWGGAEAASGTDQPSGVTEPIPNLLTQVQQYLASNTPGRKTLFAIWAGADNLLVAGKFGPRAAAAAVSAIKTSMVELEKAGARQFLIFNMPKMGDTPDAQAGGRAEIAAANLYSVSFNVALREAIRQLRNSRNFKAKIHIVDAFTELVRIVDTVDRGRTYKPRFFVPGAPVSINNVTDTGLSYFNANGTYPANYLFWDDVHPTTQGHQIIAGLALRALAGSD